MAAALYLSKLNVNGQEYQIKDANAVTPSKLESDLASKVGYGEYDSESGEIIFYDKQDSRSRTQLFTIDATDFIKDGMVSNVEISNGNLVITFNTDAGKEPISIALTDIFNPANYYNKTEVDSKFDLKADASNVYTKSEADGKFLTEHQSLADYPTIETMNTALGQKANVSDIYTQTEIDNKLAAKANSADLATVATSGSYNDLTDKPVIPEGAVVDAALSDTSENPVQNKVVKGAIDAKQNVLQYYSENEYDEETGEEATAMIQVIGQGDSKGESSGINVRPYIVELGTSSEGEDTTLLIQSDGVTINDERVLTESDGVYYIDFGILTTQGIHDADWDGLVNAINAHRPIYAELGSEYYTAECLAQSGNQIIMTASNHLAHFIYTFTKNDSENYLFDYVTKPYVNQAEKDAWNAKQDVVSDLETIRSGASAGATAYQKPSTGIPASDIADGVIPTVPTNVSAFTNDAGYLTEHQSLADYYTKTQVDTAVAAKANSADLADVATSGSYNDLRDQPTLTTVWINNETLFITTPEFE